MTKSLKAVVLGFGIGLATAAMAQPVQQPQYQGQTPQMMPGMGQTAPMMNSAEMRAHMAQMQAQMAQMRQGCERMMSNMGNRMQQAPSNRR